MKARVGSIIGWICVILVTLMTVASAIVEFIPLTDPTTIAFVQKLGIADITAQLGIAKLILAIIYVIPRTSTVGFVLLVGYYAGAVATNITHQFALADYAPLLVGLALMTVGAYFHNPELLYRLQGKKI